MSTTQSQPQTPYLSLPSPRAFMTSLFDSLTSNSPTSTLPQSLPNTSPRNPKPGNQENAFKNLEAEKKALLMTLHVIFPPPLLLQALDLLDRGGVERVVYLGGRGDLGENGGKSMRGEVTDSGDYTGVKGSGVKGSGVGQQDVNTDEEIVSLGVDNRHNVNLKNELVDAIEAIDELAGSIVPPPVHVHLSSSHPSHHHSNLPPQPSNRPSSKPTNITIHQVRSSQPSTSKWNPHSHSHSRSHTRTRSGSGHGTATTPSGNTYTVHLSAWNCTCAAFTFSAFPSIPSSSHPWRTTSSFLFPYTSPSPTSTPRKITKQNPYTYGGDPTPKYTPKSKSEIPTSTPTPICKHLLACFLSERWGEVLGVYVHERVVGRDEMGGLGC